jgi:dephospho-CoA kinase
MSSSDLQLGAAKRVPLLIALTGGIASGKSAVANIFAKLGVAVIDTDVIAREIVAPGCAALERITAEFGSEILDAEGKLDRSKMRERVFSNPADRQRLEAITHPAIRAELARQSAGADGLYQVHVIPLLVEKGRANEYDRVLVVDCPEEDQVRRLMTRDRASEEQARQILSAQALRGDRLAVADDVIVNTGTLADLDAFVRTLHQNYLRIAEHRSREQEKGPAS